MIGSIVVQVCEVYYGIKLMFYGLIILEFIPCIVKKYSQSLSFYLFKIDTVKTNEKK